MKDRIVVTSILVIQLACAFFFVADIVLGVFGVRSRPLSWKMRELLEIGASVGLLLGVVLGWYAIKRSAQRQKHAEGQLRLASGAFMELLGERFSEWSLTPSEKDVALFAIKGLSTSEIAQLRKTSEGTVKAQTNAIYRKAGVTGRPQLLSLFIEDLMAESLLPKTVAQTADLE
ncbi:MAG: helix-turn-helix transcriptional regulator [Marinosulfonomonas sp.]|nr:helix-turn-helix transcriptional regulator [Marinosulfonomonas sp.]